MYGENYISETNPDLETDIVETLFDVRDTDVYNQYATVNRIMAEWLGVHFASYDTPERVKALGTNMQPNAFRMVNRLKNEGIFGTDAPEKESQNMRQVARELIQLEEKVAQNRIKDPAKPGYFSAYQPIQEARRVMLAATELADDVILYSPSN